MRMFKYNKNRILNRKSPLAIWGNEHLVFGD